MSETKKYHISDVLSITTGRLVSLRHMEGVYDILGWMTGEKLWTHQLPRAADECRPVLLAQFPTLKDVEVPEDLSEKGWRDKWLTEQGQKFGFLFDVPTLPKREAQYDTPVADAIEMVGDPTKVIVLDTSDVR